MKEQTVTRCGHVSLVGRPNVGKSTLLNRILGQKLSITSRRPQTTRHQILGIKSEGSMQALYVDTPGIHQSGTKAIDRHMNRAALASLTGVDVIVFVVDRLRWSDLDERVLCQLRHSQIPTILAVNKVDRIEQKESLMPWLEELSKKMDFAHIIPMSAKTGDNVESLERLVYGFLPVSPHLFDGDQLTDRSSRFLASELVREKVMRQLGDELPYQLAVDIEEYKMIRGILHISALLLVERRGQKKIVIGEDGTRLKTIGREARLDMEKMFDCKVMLKLWVKVRSGWSDDERALSSLGYHDIP